MSSWSSCEDLRTIKSRWPRVVWKGIILIQTPIENANQMSTTTEITVRTIERLLKNISMCNTSYTNYTLLFDEVFKLKHNRYTHAYIII